MQCVMGSLPKSHTIRIWSYCQRMNNLSSNCVWKQQNHIFSKSCISMFSRGKSMLVITCCGQVSQNCWVTSARQTCIEYILWKLSSRLAGKAQPYSAYSLNPNSVSSNSRCFEHTEFTEVVNRVRYFNLSFSERKWEKIVRSITLKLSIIIVLGSACIFLHNCIVMNIFHRKCKANTTFSNPVNF